MNRRHVLASFLFLFVSSCVLYKSPERKDFESEYPTFQISQLQKQSCSNESVIVQASHSRLVYLKPEDISLWEHIIDSKSYFESNNFKGEFCLYHYVNASSFISDKVDYENYR